MAEYNRLAPSQFIPLTFQLFDGTVAPTRYVRAVIINATTRAVVATKDLTDNGDGDFSLFSVTPTSLSVGENNFFEVITTVYTDSGYTTIDESYAVEKEVYYVKEETSGAILGGGGGFFGGGKTEKIDYKKLVKLIWQSKEANQLADQLEKNNTKKLQSEIISLKKTINSNTDVDELAELSAQQLNIVLNAIQGLVENTAPEETLDALENIRNQLLTLSEEIPGQIQEIRDTVPNQIQTMESTINDNINTKNDKLISLLDSSQSISDRFKKILGLVIDIVPEDAAGNQEIHEKNKKELQDITVGLNLDMADLLNDMDKTQHE